MLYFSFKSHIHESLECLFGCGLICYSICGLLISNDHISMAIVDHPYKEHRILKNLCTIPLLNHSNESKLHGKEVLRKTLKSTFNKFNIIGFAVSWPLEISGQPGAACGMTLHVLDYLCGKVYFTIMIIIMFHLSYKSMSDTFHGPSTEQRNGSFINWNRPLAFMDQRIITNQPINELLYPSDSFGRSSAYCLHQHDITSSPQIYSSKNLVRDSGRHTHSASLVVEQFLSEQYAFHDSESMESSIPIHCTAHDNFIDCYENKRHETLLL